MIMHIESACILIDYVIVSLTNNSKYLYFKLSLTIKRSESNLRIDGIKYNLNVRETKFIQ